MAKSEGQKCKLLYILKFLKENSDEKHPMTTAELIKRLEGVSISCERRTIYSDIDVLVSFGYDIIKVPNRQGGGYYLGERDFELAELKHLVDAVQASRFITPKKSRELIGKLEHIAGKHDASKLQRQVYVAGRVKTENESIYYSIDKLHYAIQENLQIEFTYLEWNLKKELIPKGDKRRVSPFALIWRDENYYLVAFDAQDGIVKHYRVDKMGSVEVLEWKREGLELFEKMDITAYSNQTFGMFSGKEEVVTMRFPNRLIGVVLDRFGKDAAIRPEDAEHFRIRARVAVSGQFYGWLTGLGAEPEILSPKEIACSYREWLQNILNKQEEERK